MIPFENPQGLSKIISKIVANTHLSLTCVMLTSEHFSYVSFAPSNNNLYHLIIIILFYVGGNSPGAFLAISVWFLSFNC